MVEKSQAAAEKNSINWRKKERKKHQEKMDKKRKKKHRRKLFAANVRRLRWFIHAEMVALWILWPAITNEFGWHTKRLRVKCFGKLAEWFIYERRFWVSKNALNKSKNREERKPFDGMTKHYTISSSSSSSSSSNHSTVPAIYKRM